MARTSTLRDPIARRAVIMSDSGAGSSQGGGSQGGGQQVDPGRSIVNNNINYWKCIFCYKVLTARVSQLKQHLVGGYKNAKKCTICPKHVMVELHDCLARKAEERASINEQEENCGPSDKFVMSLPPDILKGGKDMKGVFGACDKDLRDNVCEGISRWFKDAGILFDAASHDSFKEMTELIGQYGMRLKPLSQYALWFSLLQKEVANVQAGRTLSTFWLTYQKVVFTRSKEVSEVVKDATMLFKLLDDMVEEVREMNVVQIPCAAHCLDLNLEDIGLMEAVKSTMKKCMFINAYIYCRVPLVNMTRRLKEQKILHRPAVTRFTTSFITMTQFHLQQANLKKM
ncbi:unnamed protein product, partial [Brassica napus]